MRLAGRCFRPVAAVALATLSAMLFACESAAGSRSEQDVWRGSWTERSLMVVQNVYLEEGVTIRHLGTMGSVAGLDRSQLDVAMRTAPRELMDFSTARGERDEDKIFAYAVMLEGAVVGYEGLVFDRARLFNLEDAWHDVFHRPEALTLNMSPDKPRLDPADKERVLVNWGGDWPEHMGWGGWSCAACSSGSGGQGAGGLQMEGLRGSGQTWEYWGRIVSILQRSAHAYYHFVAECLPKLLLVSKEIADYPDAVLLGMSLVPVPEYSAGLTKVKIAITDSPQSTRRLEEGRGRASFLLCWVCLLLSWLSAHLARCISLILFIWYGHITMGSLPTTLLLYC